MAKISQISNGFGTGYKIESEVIPLAGLIPILLENRVDGGRFRFQKFGERISPWYSIENLDNILALSNVNDVTGSVEYISQPINGGERLLSHKIYDSTLYHTFFTSNDIEVLAWSINVLEKIYDPGILPLFIKRTNSYDFSSLFTSISQFFAFIVIYARQYRKLDSVSILLKAFLDSLGLTYDTIDTPEEMEYAFANWRNGFIKRGTRQIADTGIVNGELRRLVGYDRPSEFLFAPLSSENIGWCIGSSSPMWYGTELVNAVSKGFDYGRSDAIGFFDIIGTMRVGSTFIVGGELSYLDGRSGVRDLADYPIIGTVVREKDTVDGTYNFKLEGNGVSGIYTESIDKAMEVFSGISYEVIVWVKALNGNNQALDFGLNCFDEDGNVIQQVGVGGVNTNSFMIGQQYQSPCKVNGVWYQLRGIIYGKGREIDGLYLNFENGRPLLFDDRTRYVSPYIIQNRAISNSDVIIGGMTFKPLNLFPKIQTYNLSAGESVPSIVGEEDIVYRYDWVNGSGDEMTTLISQVGQGYLGNKNVIAFYSEVNSTMTTTEIEEFIKNYLVGYKDVVECAWLDF
mgnify:CR=1 FL=1